MKTIVIDPVTRIEGHAKITIQLDDDDQVVDTGFHVTQVRGFADQQLRDPTKPDAASNRRVSIIVQFPQVAEPEPPPAKGGKEGGEEHGADKAADKKPGDAAKPAEEHSPAAKAPEKPPETPPPAKK